MKRSIAIIAAVVRNLTANTWRTVLTLLGIVISVAAIMIVITLGESVRAYVLHQVESYGTQAIQVEIKVPSTEHMSISNAAGLAMGVQITTLTVKDMAAIAKLPQVKAVSAGLITQTLATLNNTTINATLLGVSSSTPQVDKNTVVEDGSFFTLNEERGVSNVVVLGSGVREDLFGQRPAVGRTVKIKGQSYRVIGVLKKRGAMLGFSFDDVIYMPITTLQRKVMGVDYLQYITVLARDGIPAQNVADDITTLLQLRHKTHDGDDDFGVTTMKTAQETLQTVFTSITALLMLLAAVSLLVGGVGIMNVMLMAVQERMREIGLRKAVGARSGDIMRQFLMEAVLISLFGSLIGVTIGSIALFAVRFIIMEKGLDVPIVVTWFAPTVGIGFSMIAGVVFGLVPARRAARITPMDAMRR